MSDFEPSTYNSRLRESREYIGLSIEEVSRLLKLPSDYLVKIESGENKPQEEELLMLSNLYKHDIDFFLKGGIANNEEVRLLARTIDNLSETDRNHVSRFSHVLSKMK